MVHNYSLLMAKSYNILVISAILMSSFAAIKVVMITSISFDQFFDEHGLLNGLIGGHDFFLDGQNYDVLIHQKNTMSTTILCTHKVNSQWKTPGSTSKIIKLKN